MRILARTVPTALLLAAVAAQDAKAPPAGPAIAWENAFPAQAGFDRPLFVAFTATDPQHAYVVTQPGLVHVVPRDGSKADRRVFLDLAERVFLDNWEEGLLGFAFDPDYADNGFVYACWSERTGVREGVMGDGRVVKSNRRSVLARYSTTAAGGARTADPASELRLLEVFQPFGNHNGGTILFGPDGMLYVALGDGGAANDPYGNSQSLAVLLGKVLRLDVRGATRDQPYRIPPDNPFVDAGSARGEIWCYGLRNPWRIAFDRATGELWCGDVGQNRIEEVDRLQRGGNFGWNAMEGSEVFRLRRDRTAIPADLVAPIAEYGHADGLSITGGHVYRGQRLPALQGFYVYGDFMTLRMWACRPGRDGGAAEVVSLARAPQQVSSFAEEPDGELLLTGFDGKQGRVWRLVPAASR